MKDQTIAVHGGYETDSTTHAVAAPIYQTVAFEFDSAQHGADLFNLAVPGNIYTRIMNPAVFFESIGNPAGNIIDVAAVAKIARGRGVATICDNRMRSASPSICRGTRRCNG